MCVLHGFLYVNVLYEISETILNEYIIISNVIIQCPHVEYMLNEQVYFTYCFSVATDTH